MDFCLFVTDKLSSHTVYPICDVTHVLNWHDPGSALVHNRVVKTARFFNQLTVRKRPVSWLTVFTYLVTAWNSL